METDGRHDYLICKELLVGFVVTGLDCLEAGVGCIRLWVWVYVCSEGSALMCLGVGGYCLCVDASVFVHLFPCSNASHVPAYSSNNNKIICFTLQTYGLLIRIEQ